MKKSLPAEESKIISIGDKIIEINHQSLIGRGMTDVITLLKTIGKNSLLMKLQKKSSQKAVAAELY